MITGQRHLLVLGMATVKTMLLQVFYLGGGEWPKNYAWCMYITWLLKDLMVLIYFEKPRSMPLVLDNYTKRIQPANLRTDLKPVYSFNADGLWLAKAKSLGNKVKESGVLA